MNSLHIVQAAFRDTNGTVYKTGPVHDISQIPENTKVESGFVTETGQFLTREEATKMLHVDSLVQSQELDMDLEKKESEYKFSDPADVGNGIMETSIHHGDKKIGHVSFFSSPSRGKHEGYHKINSAEIHPLHRKNGLYGKALQHSAKYVKNKLGSKGLVSEGHWRSEAATHAWNKLANKLKIQQLPGKEPDAPDFRLSEEKLNKAHPTPTFPKLGAPDNRRETPLVTKEGADLKQQLMLHSIKRRMPNSLMAKLNTMQSKHDKIPSAGKTLVSENIDHNLSYAIRPATQLHEDLHLMFNRVRAKYGRIGAINLANNLFNHMPEESKNALKTFVSTKYGKQPLHPTQFHEEHLAHLLNYLNHGKEREWFHKRIPGHISPLTRGLTNEAREFQTHLKRGYQAVRQAASQATPEWTQKIIKSPKLNKSEETPNQDFLINNLQDYELEDLIKTDLMVAAIPRIVKPFNVDGTRTAIEVQNAFKEGNVKPVLLNGKHCKGTAIAKDSISDTVWLLKPGSGKNSPAMGVREELASQSRREIAFSKIAQLFGLQDYVPYGDLLLLDGFETACLHFLNPSFVSFKRIKQDKDKDLRSYFYKYLTTGVLYQWAALDYILGQADRHAGNMMVDREGHVKLIDAGSAFAGLDFNPAKDPKSFVPFYLRVFLSDKFGVLAPIDRYLEYPRMNSAAERKFNDWVSSIDVGAVSVILNKYGINKIPVLNRIFILQRYSGKKSDFLNKFYSGVNDENR